MPCRCVSQTLLYVLQNPNEVSPSIDLLVNRPFLRDLSNPSIFIKVFPYPRPENMEAMMFSWRFRQIEHSVELHGHPFVD